MSLTTQITTGNDNCNHLLDDHLSSFFLTLGNLATFETRNSLMNSKLPLLGDVQVAFLTFIGSLHSQGRNSPVDFQKEVIFYKDGAQVPGGNKDGADNGRCIGHDLSHCCWCQESAY